MTTQNIDFDSLLDGDNVNAQNVVRRTTSRDELRTWLLRDSSGNTGAMAERRLAARYAYIAKACGVTRTMVQAWVEGDLPAYHERKQIEILLRISADRNHW